MATIASWLDHRTEVKRAVGATRADYTIDTGVPLGPLGAVVSVVLTAAPAAASVSARTSHTTVAGNALRPLWPNGTSSDGHVHIANVEALVAKDYGASGTSRPPVSAVPCTASLAAGASVRGVFTASAIAALAAVSPAAAIPAVSATTAGAAERVEFDSTFKRAHREGKCPSWIALAAGMAVLASSARLSSLAAPGAGVAEDAALRPLTVLRSWHRGTAGSVWLVGPRFA